MLFALELTFIGLLALATLAIAFTAVVVIVDLFRGQH